MTAPLLAIRGLSVSFGSTTSQKALTDFSLEVRKGECVALLGTNGSGKTIALQAMAGLVPTDAVLTAELLSLDGTSLLGLPDDELVRYRGSRICLVPQEPAIALDTIYSIEAQCADVMRSHRRVSSRVARETAIAALESVGIVAPEQRLEANPTELSVGMQQRILIAMALLNEPQLLLMDDPTSHVDLATQGHLLDLFQRHKEKRGLAIVIATHDLGVAAELADRVCVMHRGQVVETGSLKTVWDGPRHPQTKALLSASLRGAGSGPAEVPAPPSPIERVALATNGRYTPE
jgi:ABC-type glutathione transport system ATPase component